MRFNGFKILVFLVFVCTAITTDIALAIPFPVKNSATANQALCLLPKWLNRSSLFSGPLRDPLKHRSSPNRSLDGIHYRQYSNHNSDTGYNGTDCHSRYNYRPVLAAAAVAATSTGLIQSYLNQNPAKEIEELLATLRTSKNPKEIAEVLKKIFKQDPNDIRVLEEVEKFASSSVLERLGPVLEILRKDEPLNFVFLETRRILTRFNKVVASTFSTHLPSEEMPPVRIFMDYLLSASLHDGSLLSTIHWPTSKSESMRKSLDRRSANKEVTESLQEFFRIHSEKVDELKDFSFFKDLEINFSFFLAQYPPDKGILLRFPTSDN